MIQGCLHIITMLQLVSVASDHIYDLIIFVHHGYTVHLLYLYLW